MCTVLHGMHPVGEIACLPHLDEQMFRQGKLDGPLLRTKLQLAECITAETRASAAEGFKDVIGLLIEAQALGGLHKQPTAFVSSLMVAMAEASIDLIAGDHKRHQTASADGFSAFWRAIATN